ncbi:MAG: hypothetical protein NTW85_16335 [Methylococcales bacterium]|nr:hypothetical protein [Methylococcales bacterium]
MLSWFRYWQAVHGQADDLIQCQVLTVSWFRYWQAVHGQADDLIQCQVLTVVSIMAGSSRLSRLVVITNEQSLTTEGLTFIVLSWFRYWQAVHGQADDLIQC